MTGALRMAAARLGRMQARVGPRQDQRVLCVHPALPSASTERARSGAVARTVGVTSFEEETCPQAPS